MLAELRWALRPGGRLHLIEHVAAPEGAALRRVQRLVGPGERQAAELDQQQQAGGAPASSTTPAGERGGGRTAGGAGSRTGVVVI